MSRARSSWSRTTRRTSSWFGTCWSSPGYEVIEATTGEDGRRARRERAPDLVLMDLQLPGIDGTEALRRIRADQDGTTSRSSRSRRSRCRRTASAPWRRVRRLCREADQRPGAARSRSATSSTEEATHDERRTDQRMLVVDDLPQNVRLLDAVLAPRGYRRDRAPTPARRRSQRWPSRGHRPGPARHRDAGDGRLRGLPPDPGDPDTAFLPVVMITASGDQEKLQAIEAGADDFVTKPFDQASCSPGSPRWRGSSATTTRSSGRPPSWPRGTASSRSGSQTQVDELERVGRLRRFLSPQLADLSSAPATSRSWTATGARSSWSSATCAASRPSPSRASRRRSWPCSASTTRRSAT